MPQIKQQIKHSEKIVSKFLPEVWAGVQPMSPKPPEPSQWPQTGTPGGTDSTRSSPPGDWAFPAAPFPSSRGCLGSCLGSFAWLLLSSALGILCMDPTESPGGRTDQGAISSCQAVEMPRTEQGWHCGCRGLVAELMSLPAACHGVTCTQQSPV